MAEAYPMSSGDGPKSYAQNSNFQKGVIDAAKDMIKEAVEDNLDIQNPCFHSSIPFRIADLGCSSGPNTFTAVQNIIEAVELKYPQSQSPPEFQVFFNDHFGNDFNTLFGSIPRAPSPKYFVAGVPGSFHGRLFPEDTLHFVHSSYSLHWLSKVPTEVRDIDSPAWNKGRVHCTGIEIEVAKAYLAQFQKDMNAFLMARAQELVNGGLMVILIAGVPNGVLHGHTRQGMFYDLVGSCLTDMANMGHTSQELVDSFNLPLYFPSIEDLEEIILKMDNYFSIERIDAFTQPMEIFEKMDAQMISNLLRAVLEALIKEHFGVEILEPLFNNMFPKKLAESKAIFDKANPTSVDLFVLLKHKSN